MRAIFYFGVICTGFLSLFGRAADPEEQVPPNIVIELQVVAIPQELAPAMIGEMMDEQKIDAAYARLQDLLTKGTAKLMAWPILTCESGLRGLPRRVWTKCRTPTTTVPPRRLSRPM